jgi:hypothetical protein
MVELRDGRVSRRSCSCAVSSCWPLVFFSHCVPCPWPARTGSSPVASGPDPGNICAGTLSSTNSGGGLTQSGSFLGDSGCCDPSLKSHSSLRDQGPVDSGKEPVYRSPRPTVPTVAVQEWTHPSRFHPARHHLAAEDLPTSVCFLRSRPTDLLLQRWPCGSGIQQPNCWPRPPPKTFIFEGPLQPNGRFRLKP